MSGLPRLERLWSREAAVAEAERLLRNALEAGLKSKGQAVLMGSGGASPAPVYERLSKADMDWENVTIGLVDERWVDLDDPRSNEALLRANLLQNKASAANFLSMKTAGDDPVAGAEALNAAYEHQLTSIDAMLLGMGPDGHTASWFPNSKGLDDALNVGAGKWVAAIDAAGSEVAGDCPLRMTLTAYAFDRVDKAVLLIFGKEKLDVIERGEGNLPIVPAMRLLGDRLTIVWAE